MPLRFRRVIEGELFVQRVGLWGRDGLAAPRTGRSSNACPAGSPRQAELAGHDGPGGISTALAVTAAIGLVVPAMGESKPGLRASGCVPFRVTYDQISGASRGRRPPVAYLRRERDAASTRWSTRSRCITTSTTGHCAEGRNWLMEAAIRSTQSPRPVSTSAATTPRTTRSATRPPVSSGPVPRWRARPSAVSVSSTRSCGRRTTRAVERLLRHQEHAGDQEVDRLPDGVFVADPVAQ